MYFLIRVRQQAGSPENRFEMSPAATFGHDDISYPFRSLFDGAIDYDILIMFQICELFIDHGKTPLDFLLGLCSTPAKTLSLLLP